MNWRRRGASEKLLYLTEKEERVIEGERKGREAKGKVMSYSLFSPLC